MGPPELEEAARTLAQRHGADMRAIVGDHLLGEFPLIHAVGRAAARAAPDRHFLGRSNPSQDHAGRQGRVLRHRGLDIKPESGMLNMKKDMGGAASMLALAHMLMDRGTKIRLRVLIPAVENAISGSAFRPRDIYRSRNGLTVEIGNTDAEGRLILADAIALADEEKPELIADMATLTGAARVALGTEIPPIYTDDDELAATLPAARSARTIRCGGCRSGGPMTSCSIEGRGHQQRRLRRLRRIDHRRAVPAPVRLTSQSVAALRYLCLNLTTKPGRPEGGECQAARALYALLVSRYG
jgi:leucyl aminopeptidase